MVRAAVATVLAGHGPIHLYRVALLWRRGQPPASVAPAGPPVDVAVLAAAAAQRRTRHLVAGVPR
jgi:hypothetical protein